MDTQANIAQIRLVEAISEVAGPGWTRGDFDRMIAAARDRSPASKGAVGIGYVLTGGRFPNDKVMSVAVAIETAVRASDLQACFLRDYPRWDERHATTLVSTDEVTVDIDTRPTDDGTQIEVRRTVWTRTYRAKDSDILWQGTVMVIPREQAAAFVSGIVGALTV